MVGRSPINAKLHKHSRALKHLRAEISTVGGSNSSQQQTRSPFSAQSEEFVGKQGFRSNHQTFAA